MVQISGKYDGDVSMLQWILVMPASRRRMGLFLSDEAQGAADFNAHLIVNLLHDIDDFLEFIRIILISSARYQRETDSARILGFLGSGQNLVLRQKTVSRSSRPVMTGLRAEFAVLLAVSAALH